MMKMRMQAGLGAALLIGTLAAQADPLLCSDGSYAGSLSTSDMSYEGGSATNCYGALSGNDTVGDVNTAFGDGWTELLKDEGTGASGSFGGTNFSLEVFDIGDTSGTFELSWSGSLPATLDMTFVLKGSTSFGLYLFEGLSFIEGDSPGSGTWQVMFTGAGDQIPGLSHMTLYVKTGSDPDLDIAEPATLGLLGLGLLAAGFTRRRSVH
jgi:hypothetical protein